MHSKLQYYCSQCFRVFIICVLTFWHSLLPSEEPFHFICMLNFTTYVRLATRCIQKSRLNHSPCTQAKQAGTVLCLSLVFCCFQFFIWCILFADLLRYGSLNFAPNVLFLTQLASLCISQFLYATTFILIL